MYYFDFSKSLDEQSGATVTSLGNPELVTDTMLNKQGCHFDGKSGLILPQVGIGKNDFTIEVLFRPFTLGKEQGIFGSTAYRLALVSSRKRNSLSMWGNFPSSVTQHKMLFDVNVNEWYEKEHYFAVTRRDGVWQCFMDGVLVGTMEYDYDFRSVPIFIGFFYDVMYGFEGNIFEYRLSLSAKNIGSTIPTTLGKA